MQTRWPNDTHVDDKKRAIQSDMALSRRDEQLLDVKV